MSPAPAARRARRVTLLLGNGESTRAALALLELLDEQPPTELLGLFLEDDELLTLAGLPFLRELCRLTGSERSLEVGDLERHLRIQARAAHAALQAAAQQIGLACSFRTFRGAAASLLAEASDGMDLMIVAPGRHAVRMARHGILADLAVRRGGGVAVLLGAGAARALALARRLAEVAGRELLVLAASGAAQEPGALRREVAGMLGATPVSWRLQQVADADALPATCRDLQAGMLVLAANDPHAAPSALQELRRHLDVPLLLVR